MSELEASSRLYRESGATYVTADILHAATTTCPAIDPVTFVLTSGPLVTIRYFDPRPFTLFTDKLEREPALCSTGADMFLNLMEAIIDRASDVLSSLAAQGRGRRHPRLFRGQEGRLRTSGDQAGPRPHRQRPHRTEPGRPRAASSPSSPSTTGSSMPSEPREHLRSLSRDAASLISHNQSVAAGINFQLSAALGLINIQQSSIFKVFSIFSGGADAADPDRGDLRHEFRAHARAALGRAAIRWPCGLMVHLGRSRRCSGSGGGAGSESSGLKA